MTLVLKGLFFRRCSLRMRVPVTDVPVPSQVVLSALVSVAQSYKLHNGIYTVSLNF